MHFTRGTLSRTLAWIACVVGGAVLGTPRLAHAAGLDWKGYTWNVTNGGMAGVAAGSPDNVSIDASGYLHLKIQKSGNSWTAAEIFSTTRLGFGTYQWQIDGPIDTLDKNVVLGMFPYGPAAGIGGDGTNEIDIEYSRWGQSDGPNGDWTNYPASGSTIGELSYTFSLAGETLSTSRFIWTKTSIEDFLLAGLQPPSSKTSLIKSWKYAPANASTNIPQQALPLGMNLWCYAIPSDGKDVEIIVRDFQFVAEGASAGGSGGSAGSTGSAGSAGAKSTAGGAPSGGSAATSGGAAGMASLAGAPALAGGSGPSSGGSGGASASAGTATVADAGGAVASAGGAHSGEAAGCSVGLARRSPPSGGSAWLFALLLALGRPRHRSRFRNRRDSALPFSGTVLGAENHSRSHSRHGSTRQNSSSNSNCSRQARAIYVPELTVHFTQGSSQVAERA